MAERKKGSLHGEFLFHHLTKAAGHTTKSRIALDYFNIDPSTLHKWIKGTQTLRLHSLELVAKKIFENSVIDGDLESYAKDFTSSYYFLERVQNGRETHVDKNTPNLARQFLSELGPEKLEANFGVVLTWSEQLPIDTPPAPPPPSEATLFKWPELVSKKSAFAKKPTEGIWLNPHNHHSIPLSGRDKEIELLDKFISDGSHFLIGALIAPSGAGKTRLISQWMKDYMAIHPASKWDAGFVDSRDEEPWENWTPTRNTLVIIDYTYNYDKVMHTITERFRKNAPFKIRLLFLDHVLPDKLHVDSFLKDSLPNQGFLDADRELYFEPFPIVLEPEKDQSGFLRDVIAAAADPCTEKKRFTRDSDVVIRAADALMQIGQVQRENPTEDDIRRQNSIRHPLFAALIGYELYRNPKADFSGLTRRDLIKHYFDGAQRIPWDLSKKNQHAKTLGPWVGCYVSAATLLRGAAIRDLEAGLPYTVRQTLSDDDHLTTLRDFCKRIVASDDDNIVKPFEPDLLGEAFLLKFIERFYANERVFDRFIGMLSEHRTPEIEEAAVANFLETMQRLVRNLINDDQDTKDVKNSWNTLTYFLTPGRFPLGSLMRQAISIALGDAMKQCAAADLRSQLPEFAERVDLGDLKSVGAVGNEFRHAITVVHWLDWVAGKGQVSEEQRELVEKIISRFRERAQHGFTALMFAAHEGCRNTVDCMIDISGVDLDAATDGGITALMIASYKGHLAVVEYLHSKGADINAVTDGGVTALMIASQNGHLAVVKYLHGKGADINTANENGETALMFASQNGHLAIVEYLHGKGADINTANENGETALMIASEFGHLAIVECLYNKGGDINTVRNDGATALFTASYNGHLAVVKYLHGKGADINTANENGETALMFASDQGHLAIVECLHEKGADINTADKIGNTALCAASYNGHLAVVKYLHDKGANINLAESGVTALMFASENGHTTVVEYLHSHGTDVNTATVFGLTALMLAGEGGHLAVVEFLLREGADINAAMDDGQTALILAGQNGHLEVVKFLVRKGADINIVTKKNQNALSLASEAGHSMVVNFLISS